MSHRGLRPREWQPPRIQLPQPQPPINLIEWTAAAVRERQMLRLWGRHKGQHSRALMGTHAALLAWKRGQAACQPRPVAAR